MSVSAIEYQFIARELAEKNTKYAVRSGFVLFSAGMEEMALIIDKLRINKINAFEGQDLKFTDFIKGVDGLSKSNVLRFQNDEIRLIVRPSGTEPKLKIYYQVKAENGEKANEKLNRLIEFAKPFFKL